jgi:hypothetical protein
LSGRQVLQPTSNRLAQRAAIERRWVIRDL